VDVFRLVKAQWAQDLSGIGASTHGGRWNRPGTALIYTSESRSLATVEFLVHLPIPLAPPSLSMVTIRLPGDVPVHMIEPTDLPNGWRSYPSIPELAEIGSSWVREGRSLMLGVPSAVVPGEKNYLINPAHPRMVDVRVESVDSYRYDERLLR
jgi:RES domain-containing protein